MTNQEPSFQFIFEAFTKRFYPHFFVWNNFQEKKSDMFYKLWSRTVLWEFVWVWTTSHFMHFYWLCMSLFIENCCPKLLSIAKKNCVSILIAQISSDLKIWILRKFEYKVFSEFEFLIHIPGGEYTGCLLRKIKDSLQLESQVSIHNSIMNFQIKLLLN